MEQFAIWEVEAFDKQATLKGEKPRGSSLLSKDTSIIPQQPYFINNTELSDMASSISEQEEISLSSSETAAVVVMPPIRYEIPKIASQDINQFISMVDESCLLSGYVSQAEMYFHDLCEKKGNFYGLQLMNDIYVRYPKNELLMCAILNILSQFEYQEIGSFAITLCMGLGYTGNALIWECMIAACGKWSDREFLPCLQAVNDSLSDDYFLLKRKLSNVISKILKK